MVSYQGTCEFYDNSFLYPSNILPTQTKLITYPENSIMAFLQKNNPKFAFIAKTAKLDQYLASELLRSTLFLPKEESIQESILLNMDISTARRIIKYHLMTGLFPIQTLITSPYQQLQSTIKGSSILCYLQNNILYLNDGNPILREEILKNGIIIFIEKMLIYS